MQILTVGFLPNVSNELHYRTWQILKHSNTITDGKLEGLAKGFQRLYEQADSENNIRLKNQLLLLQETFNRKLNAK